MPATYKQSLVFDAILYSSSFKKAILLSAIVLVGSSLPESLRPQSSFFSDKDNPIHQYYVKFSWGWFVVTILLPIVIITAPLYTGLNPIATVRHIGRLVVNHVVWYIATGSFAWIRTKVEGCSNETLTDKSVCLNRGYSWFDLDISGHVFLLTFCVLVLTEELKSIDPKVLENYSVTPPYSTPNSSSNKRQSPVIDESSQKLSFLSSICHSNITWLILCLLRLLAFIELVLDVVIVTTTSLYFHTILEKFLGLVASLIAWYGTYHALYGTSTWLPCKVTYGVYYPTSKT